MDTSISHNQYFCTLHTIFGEVFVAYPVFLGVLCVILTLLSAHLSTLDHERDDYPHPLMWNNHE